jgi:hypothetical protein
MAAVFAGILDFRTVFEWAKTDPDFDAAWGAAAAKADRREQLAERGSVPQRSGRMAPRPRRQGRHHPAKARRGTGLQCA